MSSKKKNDAPAAAAEWVDYKTLKLWDENPRANDAAVPKVAESIKRFGFIAPVVVWTSRGMMVAGNTRFKAVTFLLALDPTFTPPGAPGPGLVPVRYHEFASEAEARAYAIADNRLGTEADWDYSKLAPLLASFTEIDPSLLGHTGFDQGELDALLKSQWVPDVGVLRTDSAEDAPEKKPPPAFEPLGKRGEVDATAAHVLVFDDRRWAIIKARVQALTGAGESTSEIADGVFDILLETKSLP